MKATSGVEIDEKRLYDSLMELIDEKQEEALLKDEKKKLKRLEKLRESTMNREFEIEDQLNEILTTRSSAGAFVSRINEVFLIKESELPATFKKYTHNRAYTKIPMKATIPGGNLTPLVERVLDQYVSKWNTTQEMQGEPIKINWNVDQFDTSKVCFNAILR